MNFDIEAEIIRANQAYLAGTRPTDEQIIAAVANAFSVSNDTALGYLFDMDFDGAIERLAA